MESDKTPEQTLSALIQYGRTHLREDEIPNLTTAVENFAHENLINNVNKVRDALQTNGVNIYGVDDRRVRSLAVLLFSNMLFKPDGVMNGLVKLSKTTSSATFRGKEETEPLDAAKVLSDYLCGRAEIVAVSYEDVQYSCADKWGISARDCDELMETFYVSHDVYLWLSCKYRTQDLRWTPLSSLVFAAFPGYQTSSAAKSNRFRAVFERDLILERAAATTCDVPALYALATVCRNANRGDYQDLTDGLFRGSDSCREAKLWAQLLLSKLFTEDVMDGRQSGNECFEHAAVTMIYNFSILRVFLQSQRLRRRGVMFGMYSSLDLTHKFFPGRVSQELVASIDIALILNGDYYITGRSFIACLRGGARGLSFYRGVLKRDVREDEGVTVAFFDSGEVTNGGIGEYEKACTVFNGTTGEVAGNVRREFEWLRYAGLSQSSRIEVLFAPRSSASVVDGKSLYMFYCR